MKVAACPMRIDAERVRREADIATVIGAYVKLARSGDELQGLCPFHEERTPSFTVSPKKGFFHCFGCGAHGDVIAFVMRVAGVDFRAACAQLGAERLPAAVRRERAMVAQARAELWAPLLPVPSDAPVLAGGQECRVWNPKRSKWWALRPVRADAYRDAAGALLGYVLRADLKGGGKVTPQVTWCVGPDGAARWCLRPFPEPRPLLGLDDLAARPGAPVLVVEGEKARAAAAQLLPRYVAVTWPGGSRGVRHADWSPLQWREVVLWPDADPPGRDAMLGFVAHDGSTVEGVAQRAWRAGARAVRFVDTGGQPKGWDLADALAEGWEGRQVAAWAAARVLEVEVEAAQRSKAG